MLGVLTTLVVLVRAFATGVSFSIVAPILLLESLVVSGVIGAIIVVAVASVVILKTKLVPLAESTIDLQHFFDHANACFASEVSSIDVVDLPLLHDLRREYCVL